MRLKTKMAWTIMLASLVSLGIAESQTVTLYSTNPRISYTPDLTCHPRTTFSWPWWEKCISKSNPWSLSTYRDAAGRFQTVHHATNYRNDDGGGGVREISFDLQGVFVNT